MVNIDPHGPRVRRHRRDEADAESHEGRFFTASRISQTILFLGIMGLSVGYAVGEDEPEAVESPLDRPVGIEPLGDELPLHVNERVEKWIQRFRTDQRPAFARLLERQGIYADMIRAKLRDRGMPEELLYMAMMESGLSPWAVSRASAVGVWQFMGPTAQQYGLRATGRKRCGCLTSVGTPSPPRMPPWTTWSTSGTGSAPGTWPRPRTTRVRAGCSASWPATPRVAPGTRSSSGRSSNTFRSRRGSTCPGS